MKLLGLIALLGVAVSPMWAYESYNNYTVFRVYPENSDQLDYLQALEESGVDFWRSPDKQNRVADLMLPPGDERTMILRAFNKIDLKNEIMIENVQKSIENEQMEIRAAERRSLTQRRGVRTEAIPNFWTKFQRYDQHVALLEALQQQNPSLAQVDTMGKSYEGREIKVIRIGADSNEGKQVLFIEAGIHAREWASPATVSYFAQELINRFNAGDSVVVPLLKKYDVYIVPVLNVDGYEYTHTNSRLWRKTRRPSDNNKSCYGADPNRNFGFEWGGTGASSNPCSETYRGDKAFSEFETTAERDYMTNKIGLSRIRSFIAVHSYGQYWLYPWGYTSALTKDDAKLKEKAIIATNELKKKYNTKYTYGTSTNVLYAAAGGADDWAYSEGVTYSYTVELRDTGAYGFQLPVSQLKPTAEETSEGFIAMYKAISETD